MQKPSKRQEVIYDTWVNEDCNILINSCAGSGKTTTLLGIVERSKHRVLYLAFNKSIQEEVDEKLKERGLGQGKAMTLHSLGFSAIRKSYKKVFVNNGKNFDIVKQLQKKHKKLFRYMPWKDKLRLSFTLMDMNDVSRMFYVDSYNSIMNIMATMDKNPFEVHSSEELWGDFKILRDKTYIGDNINIDFTDMIYLPVVMKLNIPIKPYYLLIDEAQDLSIIQHEFVNLLLSQGDIKKFAAAGDKFQSIYGFSGSYASSFDLFLEKGETEELPLDISYRCSDNIIASANEIYPGMQSSGRVGGIVATVTDPKLIKDKAMVICRNTEPLIELYFELLANDRDVFIRGEEILKGIESFARPYKRNSILEAQMDMDHELLLLRGENTDSGRLKHHMFKGNLKNFKLLAKHFCKPNDTVDTLLNKIKGIFINKDDAIVLSTIHKSKGLEADIVYILNEHLIPHKFAKSPQQLEQEQNLKYVARTRAKYELYFLNL